MPTRDLEVETPGGRARALLAGPEGGAARGGVLMFMDAFGWRPAMRAMAERMAGLGVRVLLPDLFHRAGAYPPVDVGPTTRDEAARGAVFARARATTSAMLAGDTEAYLGALESEGGGPLAVVGYCMGGTAALRAAGVQGGRLALAASFHGGNLASEDPDSPHRRAGAIRARVYVGMAGEDGSFPPEQSARLAEALRAAGVDHMLENYVGCPHGWTVPDNLSYREAGAERHWRRMATLLDETFG